MTFTSILNFTVNCFSTYANSTVFSYVFFPFFCLAIIVCLLRVVKFIVQCNF